MVNTRSKPDVQKAPEATMTTPNRTIIADNASTLGMPPYFGVETVPRVNLEDPNPVMTEVTPESRMMEMVMKVMHDVWPNKRKFSRRCWKIGMLTTVSMKRLQRTTWVVLGDLIMSSRQKPRSIQKQDRREELVPTRPFNVTNLPNSQAQIIHSTT